MLEMYSLYKQATVGDAHTRKLIIFFIYDNYDN